MLTASGSGSSGHVPVSDTVTPLWQLRGESAHAVEVVPASGYRRPMARPPRLEDPLGIYHVTARGNNRQSIFFDDVDRTVFSMVPFITMLGAALTFVVIPFSRHGVIANLDIGLFYALAVSSISVIGVLAAGWASANKYSLMGGLRAAAQLIAYELPLVLAAAAVAMQAGSLSLVSIAEAQRYVPFAIWAQPVGFLIFLAAATAEVSRTPFDMPVAEAEIITGAFTEYSAMKFAFGLFAAEYIAMIGMSALAATLFLGGYVPLLPFLRFVPGPVWFLLKTGLIIFLLIWIRWTFPRLREDQLQKFAWKVLIPLSLVNIFVTGALKLAHWT